MPRFSAQKVPKSTCLEAILCGFVSQHYLLGSLQKACIREDFFLLFRVIKIFEGLQKKRKPPIHNLENKKDNTEKKTFAKG